MEGWIRMIPNRVLHRKLLASGIIAVLRRLPSDKMMPIAESLLEGGITAIEVTVDAPGALQTIRLLADRFRDRAMIGAGTVLDGESARLAIDSGADFLLSPSLHQDVIRTARRYGKIAIPGVMTPTELITAVEWGADLVKLFPASRLGAGYLQDLRAPFPHVAIIPTGGIDLSNIADFFHAGAAAVGIGGHLVNREAVAASDYDRIREIAVKYTELVQQVRR
jgi:2-dehydro-3-deoxyphosphogluconate aldolase/(4S)-4-hydroxy-2-oxoglutarate aldolase